MTMTTRAIGRCWKDVGEQRRGPVSLGINLATGSTNRLSPPISRQHTDSYLYCQVAAAAAPQKREDSSKKPRWSGTPAKQNAMQQDTSGGPGNIRGFHKHRFLSKMTASQIYAPIRRISYNKIQPEAAMNKKCSSANQYIGAESILSHFFQVEIPNISLFSCEDLLLFLYSIEYIKHLNNFSDKTSNFKSLSWALEECDGYFSLFSDNL